MSRLLETIRCENGKLQGLPFHQARMDASVDALFSTRNRIRLQDTAVPGHCLSGLFKCRIVYSETIESIDFLPYTLPAIGSLKIVNDNDIEYSHKFANRSGLQRLLEKKGDCDEILIIRNGLATDTSFSNILFYDGKKWLTPALPLLRGTQREKLLVENRVFPGSISIADLLGYEKARIINSMIRFEDQVDIHDFEIYPD